jgi:hypothetical protein
VVLFFVASLIGSFIASVPIRISFLHQVFLNICNTFHIHIAPSPKKQDDDDDGTTMKALKLSMNFCD